VYIIGVEKPIEILARSANEARRKSGIYPTIIAEVLPQK
jgi:hypothetical protein